MKGVFRTTAIGPKDSDVDMVVRCEIPFVPSVGNMLAVTAHGDYWCVDDVFWHWQQPDEVEIFLSDMGGVQPVAYLVGQGWAHAEETSHEH